ncbi:sulfite exporter TauE/SafE family protein [Halalkalibacterium ligniniphilum]|uniref:sulfite exporter TauE/SafE family protein n=1 Tax=Halalkalibacterium ligniniphilum TaxID=1134413 RepID=UPI0003463073|nr:sulfite exporter TauE/SafE family protein [Halalkalibacterium ligniniphilum]
MDLILVVALGALIGIFSGFFGIGGGMILTPLLLLIGLPPTVVIGTSLMLSLGTSFSGAFAHIRMKNVRWNLVIIINITGIIGTQIAHPLMLYLERMQLAELVISIFYLLLLGFFSISLLRKRKYRTARVTKLPLHVVASFIGLSAGFISSMLGVSGGFFIVPLLITLLGFSAREAVGTSLASVVLIVAAGVVSYSLSSPLQLALGLSLVLGTFFGTPIGAKLTKQFHEGTMRKLLGALYITIMLSVLVNMANFPKVGLLLISIFALYFFTFSLYRVHKNKKQQSE